MWQTAKNQYHLSQAMLANIMYWFPARKLKVIGVTGTDGKTTTASLIYHILVNAGYKVSLISTVGAKINDKSSDTGFHVTTPGRFALQSYLKKSRDEGVEYVVLETTSHALDQYRAYGIPIEVGVLTNISNEHLDYHKTYERYVSAKLKLLKNAKAAVINRDDKSYEFVKDPLKDKKVITYGVNTNSQVNPHNFPFKSHLIGEFNVYNALAAISALRQLQIPDEDIRKGLLNFEPPKGRQEIIYNKDFLVINDFAHTPNSFAGMLPEMKKLTNNASNVAGGRLIHLFGAAGQRDSYKRPEMGNISALYSDIIILTSEDPRNESAEQIIEQIAQGVKGTKFNLKNLYKIPDRKESIEFAINLAQKGDVVLLTGKGHEKSINYGKGEEPWDEKEVALNAIKSIKGIRSTTGTTSKI